MYHYGHFLDLVHQMKDKLTRLAKGLTSPPPFHEPKKANPLSLAAREEVKNIPGLPGLLQVWTEAPDKEHNIAVMLRRRTQYHHFRNRLNLNKDFLDIKLFRTMQQESAQKILSEEGKKLIEERGTKGFENWHANVERGITSTIEDVRNNLESVSPVLSIAIPLPALEKDGAKIFDDYFRMTESLKIKPMASKEHYEQGVFYPIIKTFETLLPLTFGGSFVSLYLVGSTTRGDAVPGISDINFVLVLRDEAGILTPTVHRLAEKVRENFGVQTEFIIKTITEFKASDATLLRFTCRMDGLLLTGVDLIGEEKFPKPGLGLTCLFKTRIKKDIEKVNFALSEDPPPSQEKVSELGKVAAEAGMRLMFGAAMADTARYERSFKGMYDVILQKYPENKKMTDIFFGVATGDGTVDLKNLRDLMSLFEIDSPLGKLLAQLDEKCEKLRQRQES